MVIDLKSNHQLDKMFYIPTTNGGNGIQLEGTVFYTMDKEVWEKKDLNTVKF
jgi:hypothetical protein